MIQARPPKAGRAGLCGTSGRIRPDLYGAAAAHGSPRGEISPALQERQQQAMATLDVPVMWHQTLDEVPDGPAIVLANELFDALPVNQAIKQFNGWYERVVEIGHDGNLAFGMADEVIPLFEQLVPPGMRDVPIGAVYEWRADNLPLELSRRRGWVHRHDHRAGMQRAQVSTDELLVVVARKPNAIPW